MKSDIIDQQYVLQTFLWFLISNNIVFHLDYPVLVITYDHFQDNLKQNFYFISSKVTLTISDTLEIFQKEFLKIHLGEICFCGCVWYERVAFYFNIIVVSISTSLACMTFTTTHLGVDTLLIWHHKMAILVFYALSCEQPEAIVQVFKLNKESYLWGNKLTLNIFYEFQDSTKYVLFIWNVSIYFLSSNLSLSS